MHETADLRALIAAPTQTRRLYPRGGFEGLEANTLQVLIAVELLAEPTVGDIVDELALAQGTVSTALATLQGRGLVRSAPDPEDRRRERQHVTSAGSAMVQRFLLSRDQPLVS